MQQTSNNGALEIAAAKGQSKYKYKGRRVYVYVYVYEGTRTINSKVNLQKIAWNHFPACLLNAGEWWVWAWHCLPINAPGYIIANVPTANCRVFSSLPLHLYVFTCVCVREQVTHCACVCVTFTYFTFSARLENGRWWGPERQLHTDAHIQTYTLFICILGYWRIC